MPRLVVESSETSSDHAARIRAIDPRRLEAAIRLLGSRGTDDPIHLLLAPEDSLAARGAPSWIAGFALGSRDVAVLFPARTPIYPDSNFEELVLHEIAHILVYRAAGGGDVPRWFNEGLALFIGRPSRLEDHSRVTWALVSRRRVSLTDLDDYFNWNRAAAVHAYALAGAFVRDLLARHGSDAAARILARLSAGSSFEEAFLAVTGTSLERAEESFWRRHTLWYRWLPVLTSSATLWTGITLLALFAFRRRRRRDSALAARWEEEDRRLETESGFRQPAPPD